MDCYLFDETEVKCNVKCNSSQNVNVVFISPNFLLLLQSAKKTWRFEVKKWKEGNENKKTLVEKLKSFVYKGEIKGKNTGQIKSI